MNKSNDYPFLMLHYCAGLTRDFLKRHVMGRYLNPLPIEPSSEDRRTALAQQQAAPVWVRLAVLPSPYSHDHGLLLCRHLDDEWVVWIPDHGEMVLHRSEFFFASDWN